MYNSQYYTCEQIDERLLQGYLDDYNSQTGQSLTKAQFLTKLGSLFSKEGTIDNTLTQIGYYECDTAAGTAAKVITVANYSLFAGGSMKVKFVNKNTANNATLNINSQGAKALYYQGERASSTNSWDAGEVVEIYYDGTSYYANNVKGGSGSGVYDVSKEHPTSGPNNDGKFTLDYILNPSNVNELIPVNKRFGGMSIMFVQSSDNKYIQARCMAQNFTTDVTQWQVVDNKPIVGSDNLVKSGGVADGLLKTPALANDDSSSDLNVGDKKGNVIIEFKNGHIKTKNFNSANALNNDDIVDEKGSSETKVMSQKSVTRGFDEVPVKSGSDDSDATLNMGDENGNVIVQYKGGHVKTKRFDSEQATVEKSDNSDSNLNIGDIRGNVLLRLRGGHIRTKNFDSQYGVGGLNTTDFTMAVVGDSIGNGSTTTQRSLQFRSILAKKLGMTCNYSTSHGSWSYGDPRNSAESHIAEVAQSGTTYGMLHTLLDQGLTGNEKLVLFEAGTNDHGESIPVGVPYTEETVTLNGYERVLRKPSYDTDTMCGGLNTAIKKVYDILGHHANIVFMIPLKKNFTNQSMYDTNAYTTSSPYYDTPMSDMKNYAGYYLQDYQDAIEAIAKYWGCPIIYANLMDMNPIFGDIKSKLFKEGIHPNDAGHNRLANFLFNKILNDVFAGSSIIGTVKSNNTPVSGATVFVSGKNGENMNNNNGFTATTDENGYFAITDIPTDGFNIVLTVEYGQTTKTIDIDISNTINKIIVTI